MNNQHFFEIEVAERNEFGQLEQVDQQVPADSAAQAVARVKNALGDRLVEIIEIRQVR